LWHRWQRCCAQRLGGGADVGDDFLAGGVKLGARGLKQSVGAVRSAYDVVGDSRPDGGGIAGRVLFWQIPAWRETGARAGVLPAGEGGLRMVLCGGECVEVGF
jgi:hypothetical protein